MEHWKKVYWNTGIGKLEQWNKANEKLELGNWSTELEHWKKAIGKLDSGNWITTIGGLKLLERGLEHWKGVLKHYNRAIGTLEAGGLENRNPAIGKV